jgi:HAE1 family hydrophobic/amphiphilic exporter-1
MLHLFLRRPVLAIVTSILIVFLGLLSLRSLPVSQFPEISPPRVLVTVAFPGANASALVDSTLVPLERAINGVPGMKYLVSDATSAGEATIQVVFELGTDPDQAVVNVKTRVDQVINLLPPLVQREGVVVSRVQPSMLMYVNLYSEDPTADEKFLFNFATIHVVPELQRISGVGQVALLGSRQYAMRIWLDPDRMRAYDVSAEEVMAAIDSQSVIGRPGRTGGSSGRLAQSLEYVLTYQGRYNTPEQYADIIVRANPDGETLRLGDIADVELGSEFFDIYSNLDGRPSAALVLKQTYGSNASDVIEQVKETLESLKDEGFPPGMTYEISYDVSSFLDASIEKVEHTLFEAFVLVSAVVFVFLGDWRSTLIPALAVPVSLIGAFLSMALFGLTVNLITLFALVLAIGIVVDDAIVVVEAVHVRMAEDHVGPFTAVKRVLGGIAGAIVAITLLMTAVFVPVAFMTGPVGVFYRQFSITMASAIVLSGVVALTLTPVLCAILLRRHDGHTRRRGPIGRLLDLFDAAFARLTDLYVAVLRRTAGRKGLTLALLGAFTVGVAGLNAILPAGFIPSEDQGMIYAIIQTPPGSTLERTHDVARQLQELAEEIEDIESVSSLAGYEVLTEGRASNAGTCMIALKDWSERDHSVEQVIEELEEKSKDFGAVIEFFEPPAVPGYGAAGGFALRLLDKTNSGDFQSFGEVNQEFMDALHARPEITGLFTFFAPVFPQYELKIDNALAMQKGVSIRDAMDNLDILVGSTYEQGFVRFGRFFKVYTQAAPEFRRTPEDILDLYVKNDHGEMVPYSAFMTMVPGQGPAEITRYNLYNSAAIRGEPAPGYTSGDALAAVREVAAETLPRGYDIAWEGLSFDEAARGQEAIAIFALVLAFVYLVLAAQYESFILPASVLLSLPAGLFGSLLLLRGLGLANDIYAQVGVIMLVGLLGKNAVLIVEFAVQAEARGASVLDAAIEGAKARFRPILMTSFAFVAGLIPLVLATGPGAIGNRTIGASALGGMVVGTVVGVVLVPGLYVVFAGLARGRQLIRGEDATPVTEEAARYA